MPKNSLVDVHNLLMGQLEALSDDMTEEELDVEIKRSKAMTDIAKTIVDNSKIILEATKLKLSYYSNKEQIPAMLIENNKED